MALSPVNSAVKIRKVHVTYNELDNKTTVVWDGVRITSAGEERQMIALTDGGREETEAHHNSKVAELHLAFGIT